MSISSRLGDLPRIPGAAQFEPITNSIAQKVAKAEDIFNLIKSVPLRNSNRQSLINSASRFDVKNPNYSNLYNFSAQIFASMAFARPNRFRVEIATAKLFDRLDATVGGPGYNQNWIKFFSDQDALSAANRLMFYCFKAEVPGMTFQTEENRHYGSQFKVPYMPQYNDIDLQFYVGDDMFERWFFEGWMASIMDPQTQDFNYVGEYSTSIDIFQMAVNDAETYQCTLLEAYPIAVNQLDLNWDTQQEIHRLSVTFTYKRIVTLDVNVDDLSVNNDNGRKDREKFSQTLQPNL